MVYDVPLFELLLFFFLLFFSLPIYFLSPHRSHGWEVSGGSASSSFCGGAFHQPFDKGVFFASGSPRSATTPPVDLSVYGPEWAPALFFQVTG